MQTQNRFKLALWIVSGLILFLGMIQIFSFLPGQLEAMNQAAEQGVAAQQISRYFWQQVMPQLLSFVISMVAFMAILFSIGMLYGKVNSMVSPKANIPNNSQTQENDIDTLFEDFEIVEGENK